MTSRRPVLSRSSGKAPVSRPTGTERQIQYVSLKELLRISVFSGVLVVNITYVQQCS